MGIEYELKFRATLQAQARICQQIPGEEVHFDMQTTYYDTPSKSLSQRWYTLRRRMENGRSVCTLKAPAKGFGRGEWETECDSVEAAVEELCKLGGPEELKSLVQEGLQEVCGAKFHRIAKTVVLEDCTVEIALDVGILTGGGKQIPLCEVEVEQKAGAPESVKAYALLLADQYGLVPEHGSKFRRALALSEGE